MIRGIIDTKIVSGTIDSYHTVHAILDNGRTAVFENFDIGMENYPHPLSKVHVFQNDHVESGVTTFHAGDVCVLTSSSEWTLRVGRLLDV